MNTLSIKNKLGQISDVIWIQTSFIGDIVLTTAAISSLRQIKPEMKQHVVTTGVGAQALLDHPDIDSIHVFSKRDGTIAPMWKVRRTIRNLKPRMPVIIQPHQSFRSSILSRVIGYPTVTYKETMGAFLATVTLPRVAVMHEADRISLLLEGIGIPRDLLIERRPMLPAKDLPPVAVGMSENIKWVGVAPGSVWATKRWPTAKFATLCQLLLDHQNIGIVLLGSKEDSAAADFIEDVCLKSRPSAKDRLLNLAGKTKLSDLNGIYPRLTRVISNDSSPIHYASAFNIPTTAIFGATTPAMGFGPLASNSTVAEIDINCRPCSDHGPRVCPLSHFNCMNQLGVDLVLQKSMQGLT